MYKYTQVRREICFTGHRSLKITPNLNKPNPHNRRMQSAYVAKETYFYPHLPLNQVQRHRKVDITRSQMFAFHWHWLL